MFRHNRGGGLRKGHIFSKKSVIKGARRYEVLGADGEDQFGGKETRYICAPGWGEKPRNFHIRRECSVRIQGWKKNGKEGSFDTRTIDLLSFPSFLYF